MNLTLKTPLAVIALICLSHISNADVLPIGKINHQAMSDFLDQRMVEYTTGNNIPNAVVAMVTADSIYLLKGYGYANPDNRAPVDPGHHLFRSGLEFNLYDMDFRYNELMPGMYKTNKVNKNYPFGFMEYLFVTKAPDGRLMLVTDGPMTFIKARWYEGALFAGLIFIPAIIFAIGSLLFFCIRTIYIRFKKKSSPFKGVLLLGNRLAITHAIALLATIILFSAYSKPNPAHRFPESFFNPNPIMDGLIQGGIWIVGIMGIILLASGVRVWLKDSGSAVVKVYQSIYALWALGVTWLLWFNNYFMF